MGYSPEEIEEKRKVERGNWQSRGHKACVDNNVNKQIEEVLVGGARRMTITATLPDDLRQKLEEGRPHAKTFAEWFAGGLVRDFLDDWEVTIGYIGFGTKKVSVFLDFSPMKKSKKSFGIPPIPPIPPTPPLPPMPDFGSTVSKSLDKIMEEFDKSMSEFGKSVDQWGLKIDSLGEELARDVDQADDPEISKKWKDRGLDLSNIKVEIKDGKKSISIKKGADVDVAELLHNRRQAVKAALRERKAKSAPESEPTRQPSRVEKKIGGFLGVIGKELQRCKVKLGLADPPASASAEKPDTPPDPLK